MRNELTIGRIEGAPEYLFGDIEDVFVASDGNLWVLEAPFPGTPQLRRYDANGRYLNTVGGAGSGPGEFRAPTGIAQLRDGRVIVRDMMQNRLNVYTPDGQPDTPWVFTTSYSWPIGGRQALRVDTAGIVWMPFLTRENVEFVRFRSNGSIIDTVPTPPLPEVPRATVTVTYTSRGGVGRTTLGPPYQPNAMWWWHPNGHFMTAVTSRYAVDLLIPLSKPNETASRWWPGGSVVSVRRDVLPVVVSDAERRDQKAYFDWNVNRREGTKSGPLPDVPRTKAMLKSATGSKDGRLWVGVSVPSERYEPELRETPPGQPTAPVVGWREPMVFDVFEASGVYVGRVVIPYDTYPQQIDGDVIWAHHRDELGVSYVWKLRVVWR